MKSSARAKAIGWLNTGGVRARARLADAQELLHRRRDGGGGDQDRLAIRWRACSGSTTTRPINSSTGRDRRRQHEGERETCNGIAHAKCDGRRDAADRPVGTEHGDFARTPD